jgi:hypothetical protein
MKGNPITVSVSQLRQTENEKKTTIYTRHLEQRTIQTLKKKRKIEE